MGSFGLSINPPAASNIDSVAGPGMMHDPLNRGDFPESRILIDDGGRPAQGTKLLVDRFTGEDARFCSLPFPEPASADFFGGGPQFPGLLASGLPR